MVGEAKVVVREVPHVGTTLGFRIEAGGASVAFVSDHQQPPNSMAVDENVLELCDGADLVIHDAQYTEEEFLDEAALRALDDRILGACRRAKPARVSSRCSTTTRCTWTTT